jgi:hypothetical protein
MSDSAARRLQAVGNQLAAGSAIPPVTRVAPSGPRVAGKVVIITGMYPLITATQDRASVSWWLVAAAKLINSPKGANSILGIGRASAQQFAENGAKAVYICDFDASNLEAHKREINALWPQVDIHVRQFDAADEKAVKAVVDDAMARYGRLDVFFANAGTVGPHALFGDISADDFMNVLRVNTLR